MDNLSTKFKIFDQVMLKTVKNVSYLSAPAGAIVSPKGIWQVTAAIDNELLLVKGNAVIKIPATDVLKIIDHDINALTANFGRLREDG